MGLPSLHLGEGQRGRDRMAGKAPFLASWGFAGAVLCSTGPPAFRVLASVSWVLGWGWRVEEEEIGALI